MPDKVNSLLSKIGRGDFEAFETLYNELKGSLYAYSLSIVKDKFTAEDILQETFIKVFRSARSHLPDKNGRSWIFSITHNLCLDRFRAAGRAPEPLESLDSDSPMVIDLNLNIELRDALTTLDETACRILLLHLAGGLKFREIAAMLEVKRAYVESRYYSAVKKLGRYYETDSRALKGVT